MNTETETQIQPETPAIEEDLAPDTSPEEFREEEIKDETDLKRLKQRKPPSEGLCRRCGQNKPINRLMLCYPCWVKSELERAGWKEGMPHPDWCHCEGIGEHSRKSSGN